MTQDVAEKNRAKKILLSLRSWGRGFASDPWEE